MGPRQLVVVLSGPGGVGKGTIARMLCARDERLWLSRSWTTRARRIDDAPDAYHYVSRAEFDEHRRRGGFLETNEFRGNWYGTPWPDPPPGCDVLLEIDVNGGEQITELAPRHLLVFVDAPDDAALRARLAGRGESRAAADARIAEARRERDAAARIGYTIVVNDALDRAVEEIERLISEARGSVGE